MSQKIYRANEFIGGGSQLTGLTESQISGLTIDLNNKQDTLISGENIKSINGNSILGSGDIQISAGGGGGNTNVYLSNIDSSVSGYKTATPSLDASESVKTITTTANNTIAWGEKYLYGSPVATTLLPAGFWGLHLFGSINSNTGVSQVVFRVFKWNGTEETTIYTVEGFETNQTSDGKIVVEGGVPEATVLATDYIGFQIGFKTNSHQKTLTYTLGDGHATYTVNPLPLRHSGLRDKNGESDFQHLTSAQVTLVNSISDIAKIANYNLNTITATTYTLGINDNTVICNNSGTVTVTIPTNSVTQFPIGKHIDLIQYGTGKINITGAGVTINSKGGLKSSNGQFVGLTLIKINTDEWTLFGDLIA